MGGHLKRLVLAVFALALFSVAAEAQNCTAYPYTFVNGQTANATQVNDNFNTIMTCANSNLATQGANSDITSLSGLTTPLSVGQGGTGSDNPSGARTSLGFGAASVENLGNNVVDDGSGNLVARQVLHAAGFSSNGNFTIPSNATASTWFKISCVGGGGGGGGTGSNLDSVGGGAAGGAGVGWFTGFTPGGTIAISIGSGGSPGSASSDSSAPGGNGGNTTISYNSATLATCTGGTGGAASTTITAASAAAGTTTFASGGGATLQSSSSLFDQDGFGGISVNMSGFGGSDIFGKGGISESSISAGQAGGYGAGGSGALSSGGGYAGGAGGAGLVIVEWVL